MQERLQKVLAHCGVASRRECEEIITQGRVEVNGRVVAKLGTKIDPEHDEIRVDGERVAVEKRVYYLLNKPKGYLCTSHDDRGRPQVVDLIPEQRRIYTVGRLDEQSEGLLILTNDGPLANIVCHPRYQVNKTYRLTIHGRIEPRQLDRIERGVWLSEGKTGPSRVRRVERRGQRTLVTITLWEGRNRELRRIFAKVGLKVGHLLRTAIGPLRIQGLPVGAFRHLSAEDLEFARERMAEGWKPAEVKAEPESRWASRLREASPREKRHGRGRGPGGGRQGPTARR